MRFGVSLGPFYMSTGSRRRRRRQKQPIGKTGVLVIFLASCAAVWGRPALIGIACVDDHRWARVGLSGGDQPDTGPYAMGPSASHARITGRGPGHPPTADAVPASRSSL